MQSEKEKVLAHYHQTNKWVEDLRNLTEKEWRKPIEEDKWTIAEIIGHFKPWDEFVINSRLPYFFRKEPLPLAPSANELNSISSKYSREHSKDQIIDEFIHSRQHLIKSINDLPDHLWTKEFRIGQKNHTLYSYFSGLIEHDLHHVKQIIQTLDY